MGHRMPDLVREHTDECGFAWRGFQEPPIHKDEAGHCRRVHSSRVEHVELIVGGELLGVFHQTLAELLHVGRDGAISQHRHP